MLSTNIESGSLTFTTDLVHLAETGNHEGLAKILSEQYMTVTSQEIQRAFIAAAENGFDNILKIILSKVPEAFSSDIMGMALIRAAACAQKNIVKFLLNEQEFVIGHEDKISALLCAIRNDYDSTAKTLLKYNQKEIDEQTQRELLLVAVECNAINCITFLLKKGFELKPALKQEAFMKAVEQGKQEIVMLFFKNMQGQLSKKAINRGFVKALIKTQPDVPLLDLFLSKASDQINTEYKVQLFWWTVRVGHHVLLEKLLKKGFLTVMPEKEKYLALALELAGIKNKKITAFLLKYAGKYISEKDKNKVMIYAKMKKNKEILNTFEEYYESEKEIYVEGLQKKYPILLDTLNENGVFPHALLSLILHYDQDDNIISFPQEYSISYKELSTRLETVQKSKIEVVKEDENEHLSVKSRQASSLKPD